MQARGSLRGQLLRWMVGALSLVLLLDAAGSYYFASQLADRVYDGELMEIARELVLHVHRDGTRTIVDLKAMPSARCCSTRSTPSPTPSTRPTARCSQARRRSR